MSPRRRMRLVTRSRCPLASLSLPVAYASITIRRHSRLYIVTAPKATSARRTSSRPAPRVLRTDTEGGVQGVGGITTTYYVGAAGVGCLHHGESAATTGLTAAAVGTDSGQHQPTRADQAKVIVSDALGNKVCVIDVDELLAPHSALTRLLRSSPYASNSRE